MSPQNLHVRGLYYKFMENHLFSKATQNKLPSADCLFQKKSWESQAALRCVANQPLPVEDFLFLGVGGVAVEVSETKKMGKTLGKQNVV